MRRAAVLTLTGQALRQVVCPDGCAGGDTIQISTPDGREVTVEVPEGIEAAQEFTVLV